MSRASEDGFGSRKFIVTLVVAASATGLASFGKVDANVAMVLVACVAAYNWANLRHHEADK